MQCRSCGTVLSADTWFCPACGATTGAAGSAVAAATDDRQGLAIASLVLGILGLFGACIPMIGIPINIVGLVLGLKTRQSSRSNMAIAGIILTSIGLLLSLINGFMGAYLYATGQHPLFNPVTPPGS